MIPALRAIGPAKTAAEPLPWCHDLRLLYEEGVTFRRGQLVMIEGFPGSMKSAFATFMVNAWNLPTLYVSADMSAHDTIARLGSLRTGLSHNEVSRLLGTDEPQVGFLEEELGASRISFAFNDGPSLEDINEELDAWVEQHDDYPAILVVDNLLDMDHRSMGQGEAEYQAWREALMAFKGLCRETGITVVVLHHARELTKSDYPAPRAALQGKVSQTPEIVLSVSLTPDHIFRVATVKNRSGAQDPQARKGVEYRAVVKSMSFQPLGRWSRDEDM